MLPLVGVGAVALASVIASGLEKLQFYIPGLKTEEDAKTEEALEAIVKPGFLDGILGEIVGMLNGDLLTQTTGYAVSLLKIMITFDFVIALILGLIAFESGPNFLTLFMNKIFKYGFWTWVVTHWNDLAKAVVDSLSKVGAFSDVPIDIMMHPSWMINIGVNLSASFWAYMFSFKVLTLFAPGGMFIAIVRLIIGTIAAVFIFIAFGILAVNIFVTTLEYYICLSLMLIFIPFSVYDKTERFASQAFSLLISAGTRMMVTTTLISIVYGFFSKTAGMSGGGHSEMLQLFTFKDHPSVLLAIMCVIFVLIMVYLCCEMPSIAAAAISGSLNLSSDSVFKHAASGAFVASKMGGAAANTAATIGGAVTRAQDAGNAQKAANAANGVSSSKGVAMAQLGGFAKGIGAGIMQGTFGGREEAKAVSQAASGRSTSNVDTDGAGNLKPSATVTRDAQGNIVSMSRNSTQPVGSSSSGGSGSNGGASGTGAASGSKGANGVSEASGGTGGNGSSGGSSYVPAPTQGGSSSASAGVSQEGQRGPQGDFRH